MTKKIGWNYKRFSSKKQEKGDSIRRQTEAEEWAARNGVELDRSLNMTDLGVSALRGIHRDKKNADKYALAGFLKLCEDGPDRRIPRDSYLIIESLDRLTRENVRAATGLFVSILESGINIVTTAPERVFRHDSTDMTDIIIAVVDLSRAHGESIRKSDMVGKAWKQRKKRAREKKEVATAMCPLWLRVEGEGEGRRFVEIPERVLIMRRIFRECIEGKGERAIAVGLHRDKIAPFKKGSRQWYPRCVRRYLSLRAVLGEYQPHSGSSSSAPDRKTDGEVVQDYYPRIIDEQTFYAAQSSIKGRLHYGGKARSRVTNLFTSLVVDGEDGSVWSVKSAGSKVSGRDQKHLANVAAGLKGGVTKAIPYKVFERAVLDNLTEVKPAMFLPSGRAVEADRLDELDKAIRATDEQMASVKAKVMAGIAVDSGMDLLDKLETRKRGQVREYEDVKRSLATPVVDALTQTHSLVMMLRTCEADKVEELRTRLRAKIASVVDRITVVSYINTDGNKSSPRVMQCEVSYKFNPNKSYFTIHYTPRLAVAGRAESVEISHDFSKWGLVGIDEAQEGV